MGSLLRSLTVLGTVSGMSELGTTGESPDLVARVCSHFVEGIERSERTLALLLPRVAPEYGVVTAAAEGALASGLTVHFERALVRGSKIDLVVESAEGESLACEFKVLWPLGVKECLDKTAKDFDKLRPTGGLVVLFAYSVLEAPEPHHKRVTPEGQGKGLEETTREATSGSGRFGEPAFRSGVHRFSILGTSAEWELLAWRVVRAEKGD